MFFGLFPIFGKLAMAAVGPEPLTGLRIVTGSAVFGAWAFARHRRSAVPAPDEWARLAPCAVLGVLLNQVFFLHGLRASSAIDAGLIVCTIPVFTFTLAALIGHERFSLNRALGLAVALGGCLVLLLDRSGGLDLQRAHLRGNLLIVLNCVLYSGYLVISRPLARHLGPLVLIFWVYALCLPAVPWLVRDLHWPAAGDARAWLSLGYVLVFPTVLAYGLTAFALARLSSSTTAVFNYLQPLVAGAGAWLVLGEVLRPAAAVAGALLFAGIWLVSRERSRQPR